MRTCNHVAVQTEGSKFQKPWDKILHVTNPAGKRIHPEAGGYSNGQDLDGRTGNRII